MRRTGRILACLSAPAISVYSALADALDGAFWGG
jgi:hypothetical protein